MYRECLKIACDTADELIEIQNSGLDFISNRDDAESRVEELEYILETDGELSDDESDELETLRNKLANDERFSVYEIVVEDALDVEYTVSSTGEMLSVRIYIGLGGPTTYIDTRDMVVRCCWGSDRAESAITSAVAEAVNDFYSEIYSSFRS